MSIVSLKISVWAPPQLIDCESKSLKDPLKHTQKMSSKSVQPFRRSLNTHTRAEEIYIYYIIKMYIIYTDVILWYRFTENCFWTFYFNFNRLFFRKLELSNKIKWAYYKWHFIKRILYYNLERQSAMHYFKVVEDGNHISNMFKWYTF